MEIITIDTKVYSLRAIFGTAYIFLDNYYVFLDNFEDGKIQVKIKSKKGDEDLERVADDFKNELINSSLRLEISRENKKIREVIVTSALYGRVESPKINDPKGICKTWEETHLDVKISDPKGICKTWEEVNSNDNVHKAVNNDILKEKNSEYCKMFKCDGDKN